MSILHLYKKHVANKPLASFIFWCVVSMLISVVGASIFWIFPGLYISLPVILQVLGALLLFYGFTTPLVFLILIVLISALP